VGLLVGLRPSQPHMQAVRRVEGDVGEGERDQFGAAVGAGEPCKSRSYLAGFNGIVWQGQVPMTRVSLAASTTSAVMAESSLMLMIRATWPIRRSMRRKLPPVMRVIARAASSMAG
jgi:hypothetical protein